MKKTLLAAVLTVAVAAPHIAHAFDTPSNLSVRLGWVYPIDDRTRDAVRNFIGVGVEYHLPNSLLEGGETSISVDWFGRTSSGAKGNIFPIMLNQRWYNSPFIEGQFDRSYFYFGAGVAVIDVFGTDTVWAARAGFGKELGTHLFAEATLVYSDVAKGARATSIGAYIGYRF